MCMWSELVASGAILLSPPFELLLERALTILVFVLAANKGIPLANR